jgi:carbon-monoxide dehydrogenase medium subunit
MEYHAPTSIEEASVLLAGNAAARVLAGGTDLLVQMRGGLVQPSQIIDIKALPGITEAVLNDQGLTLGAAAPAQSITERDDIKAVFPGLVEAMDLIGSTQVQGRCSVGGNLCNASPAADTVPALIANGAICNIVGNQGERQVAVEAFVPAPAKTAWPRVKFCCHYLYRRPLRVPVMLICALFPARRWILRW